MDAFLRARRLILKDISGIADEREDAPMTMALKVSSSAFADHRRRIIFQSPG